MVKKVKKTWSRKEKIGIAIIATIFLLLIGKHYNVDYGVVPDAFETSKEFVVVKANEQGIRNDCGEKTFVALSNTQFICTTETDSGEVYDYIHATYPASIDGKEAVYAFLSKGDREKADNLLEGVYDFDRYDPVTINDPQWDEDPFDERYWRFLYYSLRPTRHLLATGIETGDTKYYDQLKSIIDSFLTEGGLDSEHAWDDYHGVAFRTMVLTNTWWKLREAGQLNESLSETMLKAIERQATFLMNEKTFEEDNNHGVTQAAALYVVGTSFPDLPNAKLWTTTGQNRLNESIRKLVDEDGALFENSPYYHYYAMEKYWEIFKYSKAYNLNIGSDYNERVKKMFDYATHILQPDNNPPLIGASIPRDINLTGEFEEIAEVYPEFKFTLTNGKEGVKPSRQDSLFKSSGQIVFRSGWGEERPYNEETYLVFDAGPYRTDHSELDALNIHLYSKGDTIIRDTGLYTYETENRFYNYFYGTRGHNTVMIDGENQDRGEPVIGEFESKDHWSYASAYHALYPENVHHRAVAMLGESIVLIIDEIDSTDGAVHEYEQIFHLSPGSAAEKNSLTLHGKTKDNSVPFKIEQLIKEDITMSVWEGDEDTPRGLCSIAYEEYVSCPEISYSQNSEDGLFITLISFGDNSEDISGFVTTDDSSEYTVIVTENDEPLYTIPVSYSSSGNERQLILNIEKTGERNESLFEQIQSFFR